MTRVETIERRSEYRSGTGKVLKATNKLRVDGRKGRYTFRAHVLRSNGTEYLEVLGASGNEAGKVYSIRPEAAHLIR